MMFAHLLIATDGSELAAKAGTTGLCLAKRMAARVSVVTATEPWSATTIGDLSAFDFPTDEFEAAAARRAGEIPARVSEAAAQFQVHCETAHAMDYPAKAIIATARARSCDLIVAIAGPPGPEGDARGARHSVS